MSNREGIRGNYDRLARWYDLISGSAEWKCTEEGLRRLPCGGGERILEIGFGTGRALAWMAREREDARIIGIDLSPRMVETARQRLDRMGFTNVELLCGDALQLCSSVGAVDGVFLSFSLELFDDSETHYLLGEIRRILAPTGRLVVVALSDRGGSPALSIYRWAHRSFPGLVDCRPIGVAAAIEGAGFVVEERVEKSVWGLPVEILRARRAAGGEGELL